MCKSQCERHMHVFLGGHIWASVTRARWVSSPSTPPAQKHSHIYRQQTTAMSMPQVSHIILLHFTRQLWSSYCNKPLPGFFPCSPSLCAARTKAGQKGTRKGSCNRRWESKKTRVGGTGWKRKGQRESLHLGCSSQHRDCSPSQRNSFSAAPIVTFHPLPPAVEENPWQQWRTVVASHTPRHWQETGARVFTDLFQESQHWAPSLVLRPAQGPVIAHAQQEPITWLQAAEWLRAEQQQPGAVGQRWVSVQSWVSGQADSSG